MTPHTHRTYVEGCFRCELGRDEVQAAERGAASVTLDTIIAKVIEDRFRAWGMIRPRAEADLVRAVTDALLAKGTIEAPDADSVTQWHPFLRIPLDGAE